MLKSTGIFNEEPYTTSKIVFSQKLKTLLNFKVGIDDPFFSIKQKIVEGITVEKEEKEENIIQFKEAI